MELLLKHDIEPRFEPAIAEFMRTGKLTGVELKCRVQTMSNYQALIEELTQRGPQPTVFESL